MRTEQPRKRIVCEPEDAALPGRLAELSDRIKVPMREIVEAALARSTDDQLATHVRIWRNQRTRLEPADG